MPEVIEDFFVEAGPIAGVHPPKPAEGQRTSTASARCRARSGRSASGWNRASASLGREYKQIVFDKAARADDPTLEWVTPGHPLFEAVRDDVARARRDDLRTGAVFYDLQPTQPYRLDVFAASIKDGRGNMLHRRLFVVRDRRCDGTVTRPPADDLPRSVPRRRRAPPHHRRLRCRTATPSSKRWSRRRSTPFLAEIAEQRDAARSRPFRDTWRSA